MAIICGCGDCWECERRDELWKQRLSEDEFVFTFGKKAWLNNLRTFPKQHSTRNQIEWEVFLTDTLWKATKLGNEYRERRNNLMGTKG